MVLGERTDCTFTFIGLQFLTVKKQLNFKKYWGKNSFRHTKNLFTDISDPTVTKALRERERASQSGN